ncbi:MAG: hypothetical protein ACUVV1_02410 [Fimbriimonadales bacterium]
MRVVEYIRRLRSASRFGVSPAPMEIMPTLLPPPFGVNTGMRPKLARLRV